MPATENKLMILWTTDNLDTINHMLLLYAQNAPVNGWFENVVIVVWGASQQILAKDKTLQETVQKAMQNGIRFYACKHCAEELGVKDELESCQLEVMYTGEFLSNWIKSGKPFLSV